MSDAPPTRCSSCGRPLASGEQRCAACAALAETANPSEPVTPRLVAGRYLPQQLLGRGGAKEVWLAHDLTLERPVALAHARAGAEGAPARDRMRREARLMARLGDHPHVVTVYDAVEDEESLYIVARYMARGSLAARLVAAPGGRLGVAEVLRTGRALADALAHAHEHGVVHRDVKPDNVWLAADGSAGLGDFGIAVAGEPGIGKTRIVDEAVAEAGARGAAVVRGRAGEESRAYGPWRAALRPLVAAASGLPVPVLDDLRRLTGDGRPPVDVADADTEPSDGEEDRLRMFDAVAALVRATSRDRELVVALEDVHAADRSSLALLGHVVQAASAARLLIVLTYRNADLGTAHPLSGALETLERERRLTRIAVRGLPESAIVRFLPPGTVIAPAAVRTLYERTAGNPFFLRELVRLFAERGELGGDGALPASVPDRVREVIGRRLDPLAATTREVLAIAGVVGRPFTIAGVARMGGLGRETVAEALEPALAGRLVEARADAPGRFGFAHAIVRDAVYDELPPAVRARLHTAVSAVLHESLEAGGEATAAEAAHHALFAARCGADAQPAWAISLEAAREAAGLQAHAEAARVTTPGRWVILRSRAES